MATLTRVRPGPKIKPPIPSQSSHHGYLPYSVNNGADPANKKAADHDPRLTREHSKNCSLSVNRLKPAIKSPTLMPHTLCAIYTA